jgi:hypothetical protein
MIDILFGACTEFKKKVASLSNAKCSGEKPPMERRYNYKVWRL